MRRVLNLPRTLSDHEPLSFMHRITNVSSIHSSIDHNLRPTCIHSRLIKLSIILQPTLHSFQLCLQPKPITLSTSISLDCLDPNLHQREYRDPIPMTTSTICTNQYNPIRRRPTHILSGILPAVYGALLTGNVKVPHRFSVEVV